MYERAIYLIKKYEGFRGEAYKCPAGVWTIGYGWTHNVKEGDTISENEASKLVEKEVIDIAEKVRNILGDQVFATLSNNKVCALVDFVYNLGVGAFKGSTLKRLICQGKLTEAGKEFEKWVYAGGKVLPGLVKRRTEEKDIWYM